MQSQNTDTPGHSHHNGMGSTLISCIAAGSAKSKVASSRKPGIKEEHRQTHITCCLSRSALLLNYGSSLVAWLGIVRYCERRAADGSPAPADSTTAPDLDHGVSAIHQKFIRL